MIIKAANALIAWNGASDGCERSPRASPCGAVAVGPLLSDGDPDWTSLYECTGGAAWARRHGLADAEQRYQVMLDWYQLVYAYGVHPYAAHRAFLAIAEYEEIIKAMGCGPDKDEPRHDPNVGYGRVCLYPIPELDIFTRYGALHVWPANAMDEHSIGLGLLAGLS
jgi:hypothetical protein